MKISSLALSCILLVLSGCSDNQERKSESLTKFLLELESETYIIELPESYETQLVPNGTIFSLPRRNSRPLEITSYTENDTVIEYENVLKLKSGHTLRYSISGLAEGGSGGQESQLTGLINFDDNSSLAVQCSDQSELSSPEPQWCIEYLHHLKKRANAEEISTKELTKIVFSVLNHKDVSMYLHPDVQGRLPVIIALAEPYSDRPVKLVMYGEPVVVTTNPEDLKQAVKLRIECGNDMCKVKIDYAPEGMRGEIEFMYKQEKWFIQKITIEEQ